MFIFSSNTQRVDLLLYHGIKWLRRAIISVISIWGGLSLILLFEKFPFEVNTTPSITDCTYKIEWEKITTGALSLNSDMRQDSFSGLYQEIHLMARNPYPDSQGVKGDFLIQLHSSGNQCALKRGETVFLSCDALPGGLAPIYHFCEYKTPLWIKLDFSEEKEVVLEAGLFTLIKGNGLFNEEKMQWIVKQDVSLRRKGEVSSSIEMLKKAKIWGQDIALAHFAGETYRHMQKKIKVEIPCKMGKVYCFVEKGDLLCFDGRGWMPVTSQENVKEKPIAYVKEATLHSLVLEAWDPNEMYSFDLQLDVSSHSWNGIKADLLPHSFLMKTNKQVSCFFGRRRHLLKEGDWLIRTKRGWRHLRQIVDKERYLQHKILGELFIFEALVKEQGKWVAKGIFIDEMRTQTQPFSAAVAAGVQTKKSFSEKKMKLPTKTGIETTTYLPPMENLDEEQ